MSLTDDDYRVGHCRPPRHAQYKPGQSGNPSGRPKGTPNLKTLLEKVLKEQIALREGNETKKLTKAEAVIRSVVIGALKGDPRSQSTLFRLAEQVGQFDKDADDQKQIVQIVRFAWQPTQEPEHQTIEHEVPASKQFNRER